MKVKRIIKDDILSSKKLLELAKRVNWNEDKMLDELRKQNPKVSNSDLQAIVEAFILKNKTTKDSTTRLKSYNIKNYNTGITYKVKATSYRDAKDKYEKYIKDGNSFTYKGYVIIKSSYGWKVKIGNKIIEFATDKEAKEYIDLHKDTFSEDAKWDTLLANLGFMHNSGHGKIQKWKYRGDNYNDFEKAINHIRRIDRNLILSSSHINSNEYIITIEKPITDSFNKESKEYIDLHKDTFSEDEWQYVRYKSKEERKLRNLCSKYNVKFGPYVLDKDGFYKARIEGDFYDVHKVNNIWTNYQFNGVLKDSLTEDATLAQLEIKNTFLEEDDDANEVKYLGFNDDRKISFYEYGDKYFAFFDLENRVEIIEKDEVQRILKKNLIKETDQDKDELFREGDEGIATTVRSENEGGSK